MTTSQWTASPMPTAVQFAAGRLACPYLGLADDPATHCVSPSREHRCHRPNRPAHIALAHQAEICLAAGSASCPVATGMAEAPPGGPPHRRRLFILPGSAAAIAGIAAGLLTLRALPSDTPTQATNALPVLPSPTAAPAVQSSLPELATPAASPVNADPSAPPAVPPARSAAPTAVRYWVREGDTLTAVAAFYGSRLEDVLRANSLPANGLIVVGQELVIPIGP